MSAIAPIEAEAVARGPEPPVPGPPSGRPGGMLRVLLRKPLGVVALIVLGGIVIACAAAPLLAPYGPDASSLGRELAGPGPQHLLGTDELGRDILSRLLYGGRPTLLAAAEATAIALLLGTLLGTVSGYRRGLADRAISLWSDVLLTMPVLVVLIVVVSVFPASLYPAMIPLGVMLSAPPTRVLRAVTLAVREELYIDAARVSGLSHAQIVLRHVLPRIRGAIVVQATLVGAVAVVMASGLAFLGFGVQVPAPSWGSMVAEAASYYQQQPWFLVPTGGAIALTVLSLGLLGDAVRDAGVEVWGGATTTPQRRTRPGAHLVALNKPHEPQRDPGRGGGALLVVSNLVAAVPGGESGELTLVDGISFELSAGRTLAIVGESGCGKSVTARAVLGAPPRGGWLAGSVRFGGLELIGASRGELQTVRGRRIAFIGQEPTASLDPTQSVGSGLAELVRLYSGCPRAKAKRRALELLEQVRINDPARVARLYPHQISGGMAQRVMIARALAGQPEVLVADEPTTALDVTVQADILALLRSLQLSTQIAILLVTHDWGVVAGMADEVLVMYAGQTVEQGPAEAVFHSPRHPYSDLLLRSNPYRAAPGMRLPAIPGTVPAPGRWPSGCRFAPRCPYALESCTAAPIPLLETAKGHYSRCVRIDALQAARAAEAPTTETTGGR